MMADEGLLTKHTNAATIAHLSGVQLKQLNVLVPPLEFQREFADFATSVDKSKFRLGIYGATPSRCADPP